MADVEITWTVPGKSQADIVLGYDPSTVDANGNAVVTSASGTYAVLDAKNNVVRTDQVTGLIPPKAYVLGPDDVVNVAGKAPLVDVGAGLGVSIDNATDADDVVGNLPNGPSSGTPQVVLSTDIFGDYEELGKGMAQNVALQQTGSTVQPPSGGSDGGTTTTGSDGGVTTTTGPNGRPIVDITAPDETVTSSSLDFFNNHGSAGTTFVFNPSFGHDAITQFKLGGDDHDTLSLPSADFASIADVLHHTAMAQGGAVIHDPVSGDTIKLFGVSKGQLIANRQDFSFHD